MTITVKQAEALWAKVQKGLFMAEEALREIIEKEAWKPLGYPTFAKAWDEKLWNYRLAANLHSTVVFSMFDDGSSAEEIADAVKGVGLDKARDLEGKWKAGVAPEGAAPTEKPEKPVVGEHEIRVYFGQRQFSELRRLRGARKWSAKKVKQFETRAVLDAYRAL